MSDNPSTDSNDASRRGRARERHERRKSRHTRAPSSGTSRRQMSKPTGSFEMPKIKLPQSRTMFIIIGGIAFIAAVILLLGRFRGDEEVAPPNGIWIGPQWTYDAALDTGAVIALTDRLHVNGIGTVYAYVSALNFDNTWAGRSQEESFGSVETAVREFVRLFRLTYPTARLYAWLEVPASAPGIASRLDNGVVQQRIAEFAARAVSQLGFDGVHLNIQPVADGDEGFLDVIRAVRTQIGTDAVISVAVSPDWTPLGDEMPLPPLIEPGTVWSDEYKQNVALLADEVVVMAFNSTFNDSSASIPAHYSQWMAYQVTTYADIGAEVGTGVIIGVPAYAAALPQHDPQIENLESALAGVRLGLGQAGDNAIAIQGVAIFAEWGMGEADWTRFNILWVSN